MHLRPPRVLASALLSAFATLAAAQTYSDWQTARFTPAELTDPAISGAVADPDADGVPNLAEYFFFGDPLLPDTSFTTPKVELVADHLTLVYPEAFGQTGVEARLQSGSDLTRWITHNTLPQIDREPQSGFDWVTLADPAPLDTAARFLRLRLFTTPLNLVLRAPELPAVTPETPDRWRVDWHDPNLAEARHTIEHRRLSDGQWVQVGSAEADQNHWWHDPARYDESLTYRVVAHPANGGPEQVSDSVSLPDTDGDGLPDALEAGSPLSLSTAYASFFDQFDSDADGLPDGWEVRHGLDPLNPADTTVDTDGDGLTNAQEHAAGTNLTDYYNGATPVLTFVAGHQQAPRPGEYLPAPVIVRVTRADGTPLVNAPLRFTVLDDAEGGGVATSPGDSLPTETKVVRSDSQGLAEIYWKVVAP